MHQSPVGDMDDSGAVDVAGQPGGPEGSGTVLTPLQPMSPQRQALLSSRCYQLSEADCWDLPVDYTKIKRLEDEQDHKEVTGRSTSLKELTFKTKTTDLTVHRVYYEHIHKQKVSLVQFTLKPHQRLKS